MERKYQYFVSFSHYEGFGNGKICTNQLIEDMDDIKEIHKFIEKTHNVTNVTVLYYKLFK